MQLSVVDQRFSRAHGIDPVQCCHGIDHDQRVLVAKKILHVLDYPCLFPEILRLKQKDAFQQIMLDWKPLSRERSISVDVEDSSTLLRRLDRSAHCHYRLARVCLAIDKGELFGRETSLKQLIKAFCACAQGVETGHVLRHWLRLLYTRPLVRY